MTTSHTPAVLVTGGARGIGAATVRAFYDDGAAVVIGDVLNEEAAQLAKELGRRALAAHLDVTDADSWAAAVRTAEKAFGPLSVVVNNAGILTMGPIADQTESDFRRTLDVDLVGCWLGMRAALPSLRRAGGGAIVNVSSTAGLQGYAGLSAYVASKWAVRGMTKTAALEFAADGVRVCSVHPGPIRTPMTQAMDDSVAAGQPLPRFGRPEEVADMVLFAALRATYSTGCEFIVDGGATTGAVVALPSH
ncbi:SDR family oxidoreductase [Streptomonospora sp. PA3]|uniref:SDR family NAD(P)-dependent oxidoreductase n=1 Tax=Streptomonospora sp. PA3 TaxID=2607326 RepID=UPI0012DF79CA|nr:SDR family NAD(P)-dependent oxidoreductase [Streptomonospora sp. PA3]MUL41542.1 SDR family oxidoreductase [Streptomonospora sp. PA3]